MKLSFLGKNSGRISVRTASVFAPFVSTPVTAEIAAVSGLTRYTDASRVPLLPLKFLLKVRSDTAPDLGDCPIPMQGPHAFSIILAPADIITARAPFSASFVRILLEPGEITRLTSGCTLRPFNICATFIRSAYDEFVQLPIAT